MSASVFPAGSVASVKRHPLDARLAVFRSVLVGVSIGDHGFYSMLGGRLDDVRYLVALAVPYVYPRRRHDLSWYPTHSYSRTPLRRRTESREARGGPLLLHPGGSHDRICRTSRTFAAGSAAMKILRPAASPRAPLFMTSATKVPNSLIRNLASAGSKYRNWTRIDDALHRGRPRPWSGSLTISAPRSTASEPA